MSNLIISQKAIELIKELELLDGEITPEIESLLLEVSKSADLAGEFLDRSKFAIEYLKHVKSRYEEKINRMVNSQERIETELRKAIKLLGPVVGEQFTFDLHKSKYETIIEDKTKIDENYLTTKITHTPSKTAIKEAILAGHHVEGARLENSLKITFNTKKIKDV